MKSLRARFYLWLCGWPLLFLLANLKLRPFPHILIIFWTLLPILSLAFSLYFVKKIDKKEEIYPLRLRYGQRGEWTIHLTNRSSIMPFFLHFAIPGKAQKKKYIAIILQPGETRDFKLPFLLPYTGKYQFTFGEPIFEDLLGFFNIPLTAGAKVLKKEDCFALPAPLEKINEDFKTVSSLSEKGGNRKALQLLSDEIFSIDPLREGESMAHTHWKLSARLQQWMIKNYSDFDREPVRFIIDPQSVDYDGEAVFSDHIHVSQEIQRIMEERTNFIDIFYRSALSLLSKGVDLDLADKSCNFIHLTSAKHEDKLSFFLASLPYLGINNNWRLTHSYEKKQIIWIQKLDEIDLGSLIKYKKLGISFIIFSFKSNMSDDVYEKLQNSGLDYSFIDEGLL